MKAKHTLLRGLGFTLIETLAVIAILSLIIVMATPPMLNTLKAFRLTEAGEKITGIMLEAQGLALTFSSDVELRIYKAPAAGAADGSADQFMQLYQWVENSEEPTADEEEPVAIKLEKIGSLERLPDGVVISENPDFSSLWKLETAEDPTVDSGREYISIRFRPDGSTDLAETAAWHLTLLDAKEYLVTELPANFYTIQIDPVTAKIEPFRPD